FGSAGMNAFWETVKYARSKGLLTIADAKRGDIASTAKAYAYAFFGGYDQNQGWIDPLQKVDSITISPYLGRDSITPFLSGVASGDQGLFVLVKTSNPSAVELQELPTNDQKMVSDYAADLVNELGKPYLGKSGYTPVGAVVGALYPVDLKRYRTYMPHSLFLVPGYGSQGGTAKDIVHAFNEDGFGALINASRSILYPKATHSDSSMDEIQNHIVQAIISMNEDINGCLKSHRKLSF
ncbi:orotidine-5'-phosphate decarboxylase, partial [Paenibacillus sp. N3.4]|uniref:orotidine-5'-phosphate decarboxylase n=1 Tax=Paenibacillus sp. N3.4 TaxID=2603222 RepID=UPI0011CC0F06